jgi:hypothetical protein
VHQVALQQVDNTTGQVAQVVQATATVVAQVVVLLVVVTVLTLQVQVELMAAQQLIVTD